MLFDEGVADKNDGITGANPQPKIVVFAGWQGLVEKADLVEKTAADYCGRWRYRAKGQTIFEDKPALFSVSRWRRLDFPIAYPDFLGVAERAVRVPGDGGKLRFEFAWQPAVVRVEKGDPLAGSCLNSRIASAADALIRLLD